MPDALGVAHAHYEHKPAQIGRYFRSCLAQSDEGQLKLLGWPSNCRLLASRDAKIAARHLRLRPWLCAKLREVAAAYIRPEGLDIGRLGDSPEGYEARASVFVVLMHESRWKDGRELDPEMVIKAYNMIKHGLNATAVFHSYDEGAMWGLLEWLAEHGRRGDRWRARSS